MCCSWHLKINNWRELFKTSGRKGAETLYVNILDATGFWTRLWGVGEHSKSYWLGNIYLIAALIEGILSCQFCLSLLKSCKVFELYYQKCIFLLKLLSFPCDFSTMAWLLYQNFWKRENYNISGKNFRSRERTFIRTH